MENNLKLVDYSDSESEGEESETLPVKQHGPASAPVRDSQGRQVAVVGPTPQNVAVVNPMQGDADDDEDLEGTGIFEANENDPLSSVSTQATQGSSPNALNPYFVSQDIAEALDIEIARANEDVIVISDSSQETIIVSEPGDLDDHRSATSGKYSLLITQYLISSQENTSQNNYLNNLKSPCAVRFQNLRISCHLFHLILLREGFLLWAHHNNNLILN